MTELYALLVEKILLQESVPMGEDGYYFATTHNIPWWGVLDRIAKDLHARGLVDEPKPRIWPSDDIAAEYLGFPRALVRAMNTNR